MMLARPTAGLAIFGVSAMMGSAQGASQDDEAPARVTDRQPPDSLKVVDFHFRSGRGPELVVVGIGECLRPARGALYWLAQKWTPEPRSRRYIRMFSLDRSMMQLAIDEGKKSVSESRDPSKPTPKVGAVLVKEGKKIEAAYRGERKAGEHAEYTLIGRKLREDEALRGFDPAGSTIYTTLEPCTSRNHPKTPCAQWIIDAGITTVVVGMLDPNPRIASTGIRALRDRGIKVLYFPHDLRRQIQEDNIDFISVYNNFSSDDLAAIRKPQFRRLDDWYYSINSIYLDKNFYRADTALFSHLVEIFGGLSLFATERSKPFVDRNSYFPKAIAWWFALCAKLGIRSVEDLLWLKFPKTCPYCLECPHDQAKCLEIKASNHHPDWMKLQEVASSNLQNRPATLSAWQQMFFSIYPDVDYVKGYSRFTEELGELAEAVRVFEVAPSYFLSEAADVFAWLMHLLNALDLNAGVPTDKLGRQLEEDMYRQYPDTCKDCGQAICICRPIPSRTYGRLAHEGPPVGFGLAYPNLIMTPREALAQFDVGSKEIVVGEVGLPVDPQLLLNIYETSNFLIDHFDSLAISDQNVAPRVTGSLQNLIRTSATQRINQFAINTLLDVISSLDANTKRRLTEVLIVANPGRWQGSLLDFCRSQYEPGSLG